MSLIDKNIKLIAAFAIGVVVATVFNCERPEGTTLVNSDSTTVVTSDTSQFVGDTVFIDLPVKEVIVEKPIYVPKPYTVYVPDTNKPDSVVCFVPVKEYRDTLSDSNATVWYYAKVEGELKKIDVGIVPMNTLVKDSAHTTVNNDYETVVRKGGIYIGADVGVGNGGLRQVSGTVDWVTKKDWMFGVRPEYMVNENRFYINVKVAKYLKFNKN